MVAPQPEIGISGPLTFWIAILVVGLLLVIFAIPLMASLNLDPMGSALQHIGGYILGFPGVFILPLIVAIWIGERIGSSSDDTGRALKIGLINAMYVSLVYAVANFIIYLIIAFIAPSAEQMATLYSQLSYFALEALALPIVIIMILIPFFGAISKARKGFH